MNYYIDIIDTEDETHNLKLKHAERSSLSLSWEGADTKDELGIVGSALDFSMEVNVNENEDAKYIDLFTGKEERFRVQLHEEGTEIIIWQGFLLPDSYSEPFHQGTFYPKFYATDGLGRLKGRYLPDTFYRLENSVTDIFYECLKLTGLRLPIHFAPAIENVQNTWFEIFIDGETFVDGDDKLTAYDILAVLLKDTLCTCYQAENSWHIEGLNQRHLRIHTVTVIDVDGVSLGALEKTRLLKEIPFLATPEVSVIPPYGQVVITHEPDDKYLPDNIVQEDDISWNIFNDGIEYIKPQHWDVQSGEIKQYSPDYYITFENLYETFYDDSLYFMNLTRKIQTKPSRSYQIKMEFNIKETIEDVNYTNCIFYKITKNGETIYSNFGANILEKNSIKFDNSKGELNLIYGAPDAAELDVYLYQRSSFRNHVGLIVELTDFTFEEYYTYKNDVSEIIIEDGFTSVKELELDYSENLSGYGQSFLLEKQKLYDADNYRRLEVYIKKEYFENGYYWAVVDLNIARLVEINFDEFYVKNEIKLSKPDVKTSKVIEVVYNYLNSEEMVLKSDTTFKDQFGYLNTTLFYSVRTPKYTTVVSNRKNWLLWRDSIPGIETDGYALAVAKVLNRMFPVTHTAIFGTADGVVKFNDFVSFSYREKADYYVTNCTWNIDNGTTELALTKSFYQSDGIFSDEVLLPIVNAGPDITQDNGTPVQLNGLATSQNGEIVSYQWTSDYPGLIFSNPMSPVTEVKNLPNNSKIRLTLTVVDSFGNSASDSLYLTVYTTVHFGLKTTIDLRQVYGLENTPYYSDYFLLLQVGGFVDLVNRVVDYNYPVYKLYSDSEISDDAVLFFEGRFFHSFFQFGDDVPPSLAFYFTVYKNGNVLKKVEVLKDIKSNGLVDLDYPFSFSYRSTDVIEFGFYFGVFAFGSARKAINVGLKIDNVRDLGASGNYSLLSSAERNYDLNTPIPQEKYYDGYKHYLE